MAAFYGFDDVGNHANMLLDRARVDAFARAIEEVVRAGDVVADIGSGTGALAVLAAKAGARRVFAVERGPMAELIGEVAQDNGVAGTVELLRGDARALSFPEPPTVVVSETLGSFGVDEEILGLLKTVRARCAPGCRFIPESLDVVLSLADLASLRAELTALEKGLPVRLGALARRVRSRAAMSHTAASDLLTPPAGTGRLVVGADSLPAVMEVTLAADREGQANAIVGFFRARLSPSVELASGPGQVSPNWAHVVLPLDPDLPVAAGDRLDVAVRPRLVTDRGTWAWSACRHRAGQREEVRRGDAMRSLVGGKAEMMAQLGLRPVGAAAAVLTSPGVLTAWTAALEGSPAPFEEMTARLRRAFPDRYADDSDAGQEVLRLLHAAREPL